MKFLTLESLSLEWLIFTFGAGAVLVWWAGFKISIYANTISNRTGIGKAFIGAVLLGAITSLPEIATTLTASLKNNIPLAINNIIGGVALQIAILAIADFFVKKRGVTTALTKPVILLQGNLFIFILSVTIAGSLVKDQAFLGIGFWVWGILITSIVAFYLIYKFEKSEIFLEVKNPKKKSIIKELQERGEDEGSLSTSLSNQKLFLATTLLAIAIFTGGYFCAQSADIIAQRTGLGSSFIGISLLALVTSLPELSTSISAMRIREYELAFSDILGTNIFDILLIFLADLVYTDGLIMNEIQNFSIIGASIGIAITTIFMIGIIIKSKKHIGNLGVDSFLVLIVYFAGLLLLYTMKGTG